MSLEHSNVLKQYSASVNTTCTCAVYRLEDIVCFLVGKNHGQTNGIFCCPCRYTVTSEDGVGTLVIRDVRALDVAEFTCQITSRLHGDQLALPATSVLVNDSESMVSGEQSHVRSGRRNWSVH